jgi:hypothetical protein
VVGEMRLAAQILEHLFGATEGALCVDYPVFPEEQSQPGREGFGLNKRSQSSMEAQSAFWKACLRLATNLPRKTLDSTKSA